MFMGGADDKLITPLQAAYAVGGVRMRRTHVYATNKHKSLRSRLTALVHAGKPFLHGQADK
jgi:hypothetical protein